MNDLWRTFNDWLHGWDQQDLDRVLEKVTNPNQKPGQIIEVTQAEMRALAWYSRNSKE